ncbi:MAG: aldo/keto reductase [Paenibacillaceae bacterium]|nr:aldo/keto reductase [Paenibacillaceae bacterium]
MIRNKRIAGTSLDAAEFVLGGVELGAGLDLAESFRLMDAYVNRGGNMVDTAEIYSNWLPHEASKSETVIGQWMAERKNRSRLIVTTKGAHPRLDSMQVPRMSETELRHDLEGSLTRLGTDTIDLYWLHRDDASRPAGEIVETMNRFVVEGKIRWYGVSNWTVERLAEAQEYAAVHGLQGFSGNQPGWSLAVADPDRFTDPTLVFMDDALHAYHVRTGLSAFAYSSQAQGLFTKMAATPGNDFPEKTAAMYRVEDNRRRLAEVKRLADRYGATVNQIVLAYLLVQPFPVFPVVGAKTEAQLEDSLGAGGIRLTEEDCRLLDAGLFQVPTAK